MSPKRYAKIVMSIGQLLHLDDKDFNEAVASIGADTGGMLSADYIDMLARKEQENMDGADSY